MSQFSHSETQLISKLSEIDSEYPEYIVLVTGSNEHAMTKRQAGPALHYTPKSKFLERNQVSMALIHS